MRLPLTIIIFLFLRPLVFGQGLVSSSDSVRIRQLLQQSHNTQTRHDQLSALKQLDTYMHAKDSLLEVVKRRQASQLQKQYQSARKDLEIRSREKNIGLLTRQNILLGKNLGQTRFIRSIIIIVLIIAALLLTASFLQYRLKERANRHLLYQQAAIDQKNETLQHLALQKDALLQEKELLIKEIHHRVKNNLQVVISLLNTQSAYLHDDRAAAAIRQSQHRMRAISLIHQKLYQSESRALIGMKDYTHELVRYLQQSFDTGSKITFKVDVDDIDLDVLRAVPVGLIMNEAITNAIKYAFPGDGYGHIDIGLKCNGDDHLTLTVTDDGPGMPPGFDMDLCASLGINLMKGMCRQINGQLGIHNKNGVQVMIGFPVDNTAEILALNDDISPFDDGRESSLII